MLFPKPGPKPKKKNKYQAERLEKGSHRSGYSFASKGESEHYDLIKLREAAGEIELLKVQDHVELTDAGILYIPDFKIWDHRLGEAVWEEYKGIQTPEWRIKRKLWMYYGPGRLRVYHGRGLRIFMAEEIIPKNGNKGER